MVNIRTGNVLCTVNNPYKVIVYAVDLIQLQGLTSNALSFQTSVIPGPPFLFGACTVLLALLVACFIPEHRRVLVKTCSIRVSPVSGTHGNSSAPGSDEDIEPLLQDSSM